ncbi:hypothetical protein ACFOW6_07215 [Fodinicurvata halophila]|uniref:Uncharacterized protein n=1 Tax=Fodinicurvata halophila TaxID=1419723 RepID=A0ABV8UKQ8_9PROT
MEGLAWRSTGEFTFREGGALWYSLDPGSLNLVQAVIERYLWPPLWDPALLEVLRLPAVPFFLGVGALCLLLVRLGRRRQR